MKKILMENKMYSNKINFDIDIVEMKNGDGSIRFVYPDININVDIDSNYDISKLKSFKKDLIDYITVNLSNCVIKDKQV